MHTAILWLILIFVAEKWLNIKFNNSLHLNFHNRTIRVVFNDICGSDTKQMPQIPPGCFYETNFSMRKETFARCFTKQLLLY